MCSCAKRTRIFYLRILTEKLDKVSYHVKKNDEMEKVKVRDYINYVTGYAITALCAIAIVFLWVAYFFAKRIEIAIRSMYICTLKSLSIRIYPSIFFLTSGISAACASLVHSGENSYADEVFILLYTS